MVSVAIPVPTPVPTPTPTPVPDPQIAVLQAQVADLTAKLKIASDANTLYSQQVSLLTSQLGSANNVVSSLTIKLNQIKTVVNS